MEKVNSGVALKTFKDLCIRLNRQGFPVYHPVGKNQILVYSGFYSGLHKNTTQYFILYVLILCITYFFHKGLCVIMMLLLKSVDLKTLK